jgi:cation:H+ antiporter
MIIVWLKFAACVILILLSGRNVARYGDHIAEKTGLGGIWIGLVLVAIATSLPELFTGITAVAWLRAPDLAIGDLFGANTFNLVNLALLDIAYRRGPLLTMASKRHVLASSLSIVMVGFPAICLLLTSMFGDVGLGWIGIYTPLIIILYLFVVRSVFRYEKKHQDYEQQVAELQSVNQKDISLKAAYIYFGLSAVVIIAAGTWLAFIGREIAEITGWEQSFVGSLFLAFSTTLPEITVSFSALRLGAIDLCVANMVGSNIFNMMLIAIVDIFYFEGPLLSSVSQSHLITALIVVLMSAVLIAGLIARQKRKTYIVSSWYASALIIIFAVGAYVNFVL